MASKNKPEQKSPASGKGSAGEAVNPAAQKPAPKKLDPTRYGDWEKNGRCIDF